MSWIKTKDKLPKKEVPVLVLTTKYNEENIDIAYMIESTDFVFNSDQHDLKHITHWQALPNFPQN